MVVDSCQEFWAAPMSSPAQGSGRVSFRDFELNLETAELRRNGNKAILPGQPFQILITLLNRPGQLVTRDELKRQLWPSETFVDFDLSLNKAMNRLREALGDSAENPRFIETLPRKGYRFIAEVENGAGPDTDTSANLAGISPGPTVETPTSPQESAGKMTVAPQAHAGRSIRILVRAIGLGVVALVGAVFFARLWAPRSPDVASVQVTRVTDNGMARDLAISPDGRYVVYAASQGEKESLRLRQISTRSDIEILPPGPEFRGLTFSPDGLKVYFVRSDTNDSGPSDLYSVPMLGGSTQQVIANVESPVSFSPDGSQFVYGRAISSGNVIELRIANADGSGDRLLSSRRSVQLIQSGPSWSPDGRTVVCPFRTLDPQFRWVLVSASVPDGAVKEIYSDATPIGQPVWLSERELLFVRNEPESQRGQLWTISYPQGKAQRFTNDLIDYEGWLGMARDQKAVVAVAVTDVVNVWQADIDNLSVARQLTFAQLPMFHIAETTGGRLLAYEAGGSIWTIEPDGRYEPFTEVHQAQSVEGCNSSILLALPDSKTVTLSLVKEGSSSFTKVSSSDVFHATCSPDEKFAYYVNRHRPQKIWRVSTERGDPVEITTVPGERISSWLSVSPDGKLLAYSFVQARQKAWKLVVHSTSGGAPIKTFDVPEGTFRIRWSEAGTSLHYLITKDGVTNIWEQPLTGGKATQLTGFDSGQIFDFVWSSDHKKVFFTRGAVKDDVVMFTNLR